jgi:hypothetical protein
MANVTLAIPDEQLSKLRVYAAEKRTTVNALFRKHADDLLGQKERREQARARLLELSRQSEAYDEEHPVTDDDETRPFSREQTYAGRRFEWPRES